MEIVDGAEGESLSCLQEKRGIFHKHLEGQKGTKAKSKDHVCIKQLLKFFYVFEIEKVLRFQTILAPGQMEKTV